MSDHTAVESNRSHWDENASTYNSKFEKTILQIIAEVQARLDWIGVDWIEDSSGNETSESSSKGPTKEVRLLDYACGTGLVSRALAPHVTQCVGIDLSEGMVDEYNKTVENQGIPHSEMFAQVGNLLDESDPSPAALSGPEFYNFDIAVVGLGFHHFDKPSFAAKQLAARLKPGGVLLIIDFLPHGDHKHNHDHPAAHTVTHLGFSEEAVKTMFEEAGVGGRFEYDVVGKGIVFHGVKEEGNTMSRSVFMARGFKL
ncbi:S-adenosyl-L-methionine-dependent methyltransferase [Venustampulla echinocandica]|uniref:S-adenosyl-L-methionine-dependent methyltransferase n=1 Tax=Venustampulla echinocandica TaxID=2656787 RepID=A0A370TZW6_9HELO|nr:S-adenosyl-L-methionine-dependent methyltransferase [Venustampulla echinocandica]RDL41048.1 S-adenosyl-L-methionine-dependent methyltransferase [Venustampulla echinocandica]